jgi:hypothetical protein
VQISQLQSHSTELEIARQDLEVELKILLGNRTNIAAEIEARASAKASQVISPCTPPMTLSVPAAQGRRVTAQ